MKVRLLKDWIFNCAGLVLDLPDEIAIPLLRNQTAAPALPPLPATPATVAPSVAGASSPIPARKGRDGFKGTK
jgi:hypothetical protein